MQLLGAQGGVGGRHFAFALPQPPPYGPDQLPKFIQLLLAGRRILFSESEKVSESQSSCFALQLPWLECSTVVSLGVLFIIIIRCCLGTAGAAPAKVGCAPQPAPHCCWPSKPRPVALSGVLRHRRGTTTANLRWLCTGLFVLGGAKVSGRQGSFMPSRSSQLQPRGGQALPPLLPGHSSHLFSPSQRNKAAPGQEPPAPPAHPR